MRTLWNLMNHLKKRLISKPPKDIGFYVVLDDRNSSKELKK